MLVLNKSVKNVSVKNLVLTYISIKILKFNSPYFELNQFCFCSITVKRG